MEEVQGVQMLEADAVVDAICRRLTKSAASCANLSQGAVSQAPMGSLWVMNVLPVTSWIE